MTLWALYLVKQHLGASSSPSVASISFLGICCVLVCLPEQFPARTAGRGVRQQQVVLASCCPKPLPALGTRRACECSHILHFVAEFSQATCCDAGKATRIGA